ncbi:MAG: protein kinase, partial [Planctomycetes bacterium]|nr:protein kinase [Planctomycetota bacterium]
MIPPSPLALDRLLETLPRDSQSRPLIGGIALTKRLGAGGMGAVYLGVHVSQRRNVAVKILPFNLLEQSPHALKRFEAEARLAAGLTSDHVVRVFDVGAEHRTHFIVMEYVPGDSAGGMVRKRIAAGKGPFSEGEALRIALGAARGLAAAHGKGITHRDIKPDNILIPEGDLDRAKVADLGLAKPEEGSTTVGTLSHVAMGTPGYMAPEQAESAKGAGPAADVFALGGTIYTLLTGNPPFKGETLMAILRATVGEAPQPLPEGTSPGVKWLVDKALSKKAERRFADGTEFAAAIEKVIADPDDAPEEARRPGGLRRSMDGAARVDLRQGPKSRVPAVVAGVAVLVLSAAGIAIYKARNPRGDPSKSGTVVGPSRDPALDARFMEAGRLGAAGKREELRKLLAGLAAQAPDDPRITAYRDRLLELDKEGAKREAKASVARIVASVPNTPELWDAAAQAAASLLEIADTDERRKAARALEDEAMAHRDLAFARRKEKADDLAGALDDARKLADNPSLKDIGEYITSLERKLKDRELLESRARDFKAACAAAEKEQDPQKALEIWRKARELTTDLNEVARIGERIRALEGSVPPVEAADYETAMREGGELLGQKRQDEAEAAFRRALALRPGDPKATDQLNRLAEARLAQEYGTAATAAAEAQARGDWAAVKAAALRMSAAKPNDAAATKLLSEAKKHLAGPEPVTPVVNKGRFSVVLDASRGLKMDFVVLPHATVTIGDGTETRRATLSKDFAIATTEVTQDHWMELMGWNPPHHPGGAF